MSSKTKYVIIDPSMGVFLGTYSMKDFFEEDDATEDVPEYSKSYALFAVNNPFGISRAYGFECEEDASSFIETSFPNSGDEFDMFAVPVNTSDNYPSVVDIIKAGYGDFTFDMLAGLESPSEMIH